MQLRLLQDVALDLLKKWQARYFAAAYRGLAEDILSEERLSTAEFLCRAEEKYPRPEQVQRLLIFKPDEIGDAVYSLPALKALRDHFPRTEIHLVCQPKCQAIYERSHLVDRIHAVRTRVRFRRFVAADIKSLLKQSDFGNFDVSIFLRTYPAYFRDFLKIPARVRIHPRDPRLLSPSSHTPLVSLWTTPRAHSALQLLQIVAPLVRQKFTESGISFPSLLWEHDDKEALKKTFGDSVPATFGVIHPYANYETRAYPLAYWKRVIHELTQRWKCPFVVVGGPGDPEVFPAGTVIPMQGKLSLAQTGYLLSQASIFIGNESGPGHLAAAQGVPTIMLMGGHSLVEEWAPLHKTLVLKTEVSCSPCHLRTCYVNGLICLTRLSPEKILPAIEEFGEKALHGERACLAPTRIEQPV